MDAATSATVFAAAAHSTWWKRTNLGLVTEVSHASYTWTVELPPANLDANGDEVPSRALIIGRYGYGGTELLDVEATFAQTIPIVEAAMSALRIH